MSEELKGCKQKGNHKHGHARGNVYSLTYSSWQCMLNRCRRTRYNSRLYKDNGIKVCDRWLVFENFLKDMGERPQGKTLDRWPDSKGNYEPGNCRWATPTEQARNTRKNKLTLESATKVAYKVLKGESCVKVSKEFGISENLPREIVKGRAWKDALIAAKKIIDTETHKHHR